MVTPDQVGAALAAFDEAMGITSQGAGLRKRFQAIKAALEAAEACAPDPLDLLGRFMQHVHKHEGCDFVQYRNVHDAGALFTWQEWELLKQISDKRNYGK